MFQSLQTVWSRCGPSHHVLLARSRRWPLPNRSGAFGVLSFITVGVGLHLGVITDPLEAAC